MQLYDENNTRKSIVLGVDVGTTNIRCIAYDQSANVLGRAQEKLDVYNPSDDVFEIIPDVLWNSFKRVVNNCLISSHLHANEVSCMGISTQRATFLTWERETGQPFHNFISWKDRRADAISEKYNSSFLIKILRFICFLLYVVTRITKLQLLSSIKFQSAMATSIMIFGNWSLRSSVLLYSYGGVYTLINSRQSKTIARKDSKSYFEICYFLKVLMRLYWILEHFPEIRQRSVQGEVLFGTIDTWLVWKLTDGKVHATDGSNACVTGLFDPFSMVWNDWILRYFRIPKKILPVVKNTCDSFGETLPHIFGSSIPIYCLVGDQQASMFGVCCFQKYDVNCTMGTGSFLSINTGDKPSTSHYGIIPLIGWTIKSKTTYVAECGFHETGPFVTWMQNLGFFTNPFESSRLAQNVIDNGGLYFLPTCNFQKYSETDKLTASRFVGLRSNSSKENLVRSVLESLAFQVSVLFHDIHQLFNEENKIPALRICGGIANNDFVIQTVSTITEKQVLRFKHNEASSLGAAFLAGLHCGIWKSLEELKDLQIEYDLFYPASVSENRLLNSFKNWKFLLKKHL